MSTIEPLNLRQYHNIVILTGTNIAAGSYGESYRNLLGHNESDNIAWITQAGNLPRSLPKLWELYSRRRTYALEAEPSAAHYAIAGLQKGVTPTQTVTLLTQNVNNLHQRAGSPEVIELYGSAFRTRCTNSSCTSKPFYDKTIYGDTPPLCSSCGEALRPDVTLFGERIAKEVWEKAGNALNACDLFISAGVADEVWPVDRFAGVAASKGAHTILVDTGPGLDDSDDFHQEFFGKAATILPALFGQ